jgi:hypothetical protein
MEFIFSLKELILREENLKIPLNVLSYDECKLVLTEFN